MVLGCADKKQRAAPPDTHTEIPSEITVTDSVRPIPIGKTVAFPLSGSQADTLRIVELSRTPLADDLYALSYRIEFRKDKRKLHEFSGTLRISAEEFEAEWYATDDFMGSAASEVKDKRFVHIDFGYPACGYTHKSWLFFTGAQTVSLVTEWDSMMDSGYGTYRDFTASMRNGKAVEFSSVVVSIGALEDERQPDMLDIAYSDSVRYKPQNDTWMPTLVTTRNKPFRKEIKTFDAFYK